MKSAEIRENFLKYFESHGHQRVPSSSLIPAADPTLLFTNAGMVQFKDCFLGLTDPGYRRATTSQKCVRAGGKHNDLENVGVTPRHHTFFEMLGNFSFGDYFKKEAIDFAWELVTKVYKIPESKLWVTVYKDDQEAFDLWKKRGVRPERIVKLGEKDNFWAMGDTGPCGPCTEIHYDWGDKVGCGKPDCAPGCACDVRFLEIWNLVFMQFNRDSSGNLTPLPKPSVDTGAGLERLSCVLQGVFSNYDTDLFAPLITAIAKAVGKKYGENKDNDISMRVIADHLRSGTFLLSDGVTPSNEGRGYVLRRILRRAIRHGKKLGQEKPFLHQLVKEVCQSLGKFYPDIEKNRKLVETQMREEEERFHETLHRGIGLLEGTIHELTAQKKNVLPGDIAFKLYDSFGFPYDLIEILCQENGLTVDQKTFESLMEKQRAQSSWTKGNEAGSTEAIAKVLQQSPIDVKFLGYDSLTSRSKLVHVFDKDGREVAALKAGESGYAVFDSSPFYAESGGQIGDEGLVLEKGVEASVETTQKIAKTVVHKLTVKKGQLERGKNFDLAVDAKARRFTAINHTATHMLHAALRTVLGDRVKQAGSLVDSNRLRFDFTYPRGLTPEEKTKIETIINDEILENRPVSKQEMAYDKAIEAGALAFFDEKYGDRVRVITIGGGSSPFSVELCGGTHLDNISQIGYFKITSESSVASGVRRIEAVTSQGAFRLFHERETVLQDKVQQLSQEIKDLKKSGEELRLKLAQGARSGGGSALYEKALEINGFRVVRESIPSADAKILRTLVDQVRDKLKDKTIVVLASANDGKVALCAGITKDLGGVFDASKIIKELAPTVGGTGGGKSDFAQAGGNLPDGIPAAFQKLEQLVSEQGNK